VASPNPALAPVIRATGEFGRMYASLHSNVRFCCLHNGNFTLGLSMVAMSFEAEVVADDE
jgi:hypothetical protein